MNSKPKKYNPYYHKNRKHEPIPVGEALSELFKAMRIDNRIAEVQILKIWNETMGEFIAKKTTDIQLRNKELVIRVDSAVLRKELQMNEQLIIGMMNQKIGSQTIEKVIIR